MLQNFVLTTSDIIDIFGIIASLVVSIVAVSISIFSLKQNSKMIEESTRPNIQIYPVFADSILYIVIKNFGASEAIIDEVTCSHAFSSAETFGTFGQDIFSGLRGAVFSPGYSVRCPLVSSAVEKEIYNFQIRYHSPKKKYSASFDIDPYANAPFADTYPSADTIEKHLANISKDLHNIFKFHL